jgi:mRNA-degrading endonuclease RelE of RelBE toxin-antitoxin system
MHKTTTRFRKCLKDLPPPIQKTAQDNFELLKENSRHPSLHFKKIGRFWSVRIGLDYRVLALEDDSDFIWVWIGGHDEYERIISRDK